jgi:hypothetical protein
MVTANNVIILLALSSMVNSIKGDKKVTRSDQLSFIPTSYRGERLGVF